MDFERIAALEYVDLYVAPGFADVKVRPGYHSPREEVPADLSSEIEDLRKALLERLSEVGSPEFSFRMGGKLHRVTAMTTAEDALTFVLRRASDGVRSLASLNVPKHVRAAAVDRGLRGLVLVVGAQASGKTSTLMAMFCERMRALGGVGVAIEDPIETDGLAGLHGEGRIHHYSASRHQGGYAEQIIKSLRHGADAILMGEIREPAAAQIVLREAANGSTIFSTAHAASIPEALARLCDFFPNTADGRAMLAHSLRFMIHQDLESSAKGSLLRCTTLSLQGADAKRIQQKIIDGRFSHIEEEIADQRKKALMQPA